METTRVYWEDIGDMLGSWKNGNYYRKGLYVYFGGP